MTFAKPRAATSEDIKNVIEGFAHAAEYLEKSGWDGVELHGGTYIRNALCSFHRGLLRAA